MSLEEDLAEKLATSIPGLKTAASAVGLENHRQTLADAASRVRDSHRAQMKAMGMDVDEAESPDMGNIVITGDINTKDPAAVIDSLSSQQSAQKQAPAKPTSSLARTLAAAGLVLAGSAAPIAAWNLTRPSQPSEAITEPATDTDTQYGLRIYRGDQ